VRLRAVVAKVSLVYLASNHHLAMLQVFVAKPYLATEHLVARPGAFAHLAGKQGAVAAQATPLYLARPWAVRGWVAEAKHLSARVAATVSVAMASRNLGSRGGAPMPFVLDQQVAFGKEQCLLAAP